MGWYALPDELRLMVFHYLVPEPVKMPTPGEASPPHPLSNYAAVSRQWQLFFERENFNDLSIRQSDIPYFKKIVHKERRPLIRMLWLRIELLEYDCIDCDRRETDTQAHTNSVIFTQAIHDLFDVLVRWEFPDMYTNPPITFTLGLHVYSRSDRLHEFRDHRVDDHGGYTYNGERKSHNDGRHGWFHGEKTFPTSGAKMRLFGKPLEFNLGLLDTARSTKRIKLEQKLPKVHSVRGLWLPRQFYRAIPDLDRIVDSLPKLRELRVESWRPLGPGDRGFRDLDLRRLVQAFPPGLLLFSLFEDRDQLMHFASRPTDFPLLAHELRRASVGLKALNASFIFDADRFLQPFFPGYKGREPRPEWPKLEVLVLTSYTLIESPSLKEGESRVDRLLVAAARAALHMPKLRVLEIWSGETRRGCVFRYSAAGHGGTAHPQLHWVCTDGVAQFGYVSESVTRAWQRVVDKYAREMRVRVDCWSKQRKNIRSHTSMLRHVSAANHVLTPQSLEQIRWEERNMGYDLRRFLQSELGLGA